MVNVVLGHDVKALCMPMVVMTKDRCIIYRIVRHKRCKKHGLSDF